MATDNKNIPSQSSWSLIKIIYNDYLGHYIWYVLGAVLLMSIGASMTAAQAFLMEPVINDIFVNKDQAMLVPLAFTVFFAFVIRGTCTWGESTIMAKVGQSILAEVQRRLFRRIITRNLIFFHKHPSGELISRMTSDVGLMRIAVAEGLTGFIRAGLTLAFLIGVMFYRDWKLSVLAFTVFPAAAFVFDKIGRKIRHISGNTQSELADFSSFLNQIFQGIRHVKANVKEQFEQERAGKIIHRLYKYNYKIIRIAALSKPISETLTAIAVVSIILYGGYQVIQGNNTPGAFFSFITAFIMAYEPMKKLAKLNNSVQTGLAASERVFEILYADPKRDATPSGTKEEQFKAPNIAFKDVSFSYPDGTVALKNVSFTVEPGKKVAIVGASGSGKSTLMNLIPRFYDIGKGSGQILIDGTDISSLTLDSLRENIGLVSQNPAIFDESVKENILYGQEGASDDEVIEAAKQAMAHDFIEEFDKGYDTRLGEQGVRLSGGQKQRIAIARTILRNAPILLLDEATSALDNESERQVTEALKYLQKGRTTLVVAHRLSTIVDADLIYVLDKGAIVEHGTHQELLTMENGVYAKLYKHAE